LISSKGTTVIDIGSIINDRYEIVSSLGQGGAGAVYKCRDRVSGKLFAIKLLFANRLQNPQAILRFQREAQIAARLNHPFIAKLHDYGVTVEGEPYLVMDLINGSTLGSKIASQGQLPVDETLHVFSWVCDALNHAHQRQILHRDLKPSNIMLTESADGLQSISILDFGIAKILSASEAPSPTLTQCGEILGSPFYMSPEQATGAPIDQRSDLYSLGCTIYETLTGGPPHIGDNPLSTLLKRETDKPLRMNEASMGRRFPEELEDVVAKLLNHDPNQRFQSALELKEALVKLLEQQPPSSVPANNITTGQPLQHKSSIPYGEFALYASLLCALLLVGYLNFPGTPSKQQTKLPSPALAPKHEKQVQVTHFNANSDSLVVQAEKLAAKKQYALAAEKYKQAIHNYESKFGLNSGGIAGFWEGLATVYAKSNQIDEEIQARERSVALYRQGLAPNDPSLIESMLSLADCYKKANRSDVASLLKETTLNEEMAKQYKLIQKEKVIAIGRCLVATAAQLEQKNHHEHDIAAYSAAFTLLSSTIGLTRPGAQEAGWRLADCYRTHGKAPLALQYDMLILDACEKSDPVNPFRLCKALMCAASNYSDPDTMEDTRIRLKTQESYYRRALDICEDHQKVLATDMGAILLYLSGVESQMADMGDPAHSIEAALLLLHRSIAAYKLHADQETQIAVVYNAIADLELKENHKQEAMKYRQLAKQYLAKRINIITQSPKPNLSELFYVRSYYTDTCVYCMEYSQAESQDRELLDFANSNFEKISPQRMRVLGQLGDIYRLDQKYSQSVPLLEEAANINEELFGVQAHHSRALRALCAEAKRQIKNSPASSSERSASNQPLVK
jgi:serine/threonine protein kinase